MIPAVELGFFLVTDLQINGDVQQLTGGRQRLLVDLQRAVEHEFGPVGPFQRKRTVQTVLRAAPHVVKRYLLQQPAKT